MGPGRPRQFRPVRLRHARGLHKRVAERGGLAAAPRHGRRHPRDRARQRGREFDLDPAVRTITSPSSPWASPRAYGCSSATRNGSPAGTLGVPGIVRPFTGWVRPLRATRCSSPSRSPASPSSMPWSRSWPVALRPDAPGLREDPTVAEALGKDVLWLRLRAFGPRRRRARHRGQPARLQLHLHRPDPVRSGDHGLRFYGGNHRGARQQHWRPAGRLHRGPAPRREPLSLDAFGLLDGAQLAALRLFLVGVALVTILIVKPGALCASIA